MLSSNQIIEYPYATIDVCPWIWKKLGIRLLYEGSSFRWAIQLHDNQIIIKWVHYYHTWHISFHNFCHDEKTSPNHSLPCGKILTNHQTKISSSTPALTASSFSISKQQISETKSFSFHSTSPSPSSYKNASPSES